MDVVIVREGEAVTATGSAAPGRFDRLPRPIRIEDTVTTQETGPRPGVDESRDPERDYMLRYAG